MYQYYRMRNWPLMENAHSCMLVAIEFSMITPHLHGLSRALIVVGIDLLQ